MASSMIHIAIASEINRKLKRDSSKILIGTIAPDISKLIGKSREKSHFIAKNTQLPDLNRFLKKYEKYLDDDFVLGYYIHLYADYLWFKYFIPRIFNNNMVRKLNGDKINCSPEMQNHYIYNDYTNLNIKIIEEYDLDLKIFYNEIPKFENIIKEIPMDKIDIIVNNAGMIIENSKKHKAMIFNMEYVNNFIAFSTEKVYNSLKEIGIK